MDNIAKDFLKQAGVKVRELDDDRAERELKSWGIEESVLDPVHDKLAPDFWTDNEDHVKPKHRDYILDVLNKWLKKMEVDKAPKQVAIIGSITTYQYTDTSDIDVNVVVDVSDEKREELISMLPNGDLLPGTKHPINYYIAEDAGENVKKKDSAYDLLNDKWMKKPEKKDVKLPYNYILEIAKFFMAGIDSRIAEYERDKVEIELHKHYLKEKDIKVDTDEVEALIESKQVDLLGDLDSIFVALKMAKAFRGQAFEEDYEPNFLINIEMKNPDFSVNNLVYKTLERFGYLEKLEKYKKIREEEVKKREPK